jgi:hypothetical protein
MLEEYFRLFYFAAPEDAGLPGYFRNLLFSDVKLEPKLSPLSANGIDRSSSLIAFGSPAYNVVSGWIQSELHSLGTFSIDSQTINVGGLPPLTEVNTAFLQRARITASTFAFYAAGFSSLGTRAAVYYLASRWERLHRRFGERENFIVVLRAIDERDHRKHIVLLERGEEL